MQRSARRLAPIAPLMGVMMLIGSRYIGEDDVILRIIGLWLVAGGALVLCGIALVWWRERARSRD